MIGSDLSRKMYLYYKLAVTDSRISPLQEIYFFFSRYSIILCVFSCYFSELNFKKITENKFFPHKYKANVVCNELNNAGLKERKKTTLKTSCK